MNNMTNVVLGLVSITMDVSSVQNMYIIILTNRLKLNATLVLVEQ